jgi:hypothetical protein
MLLPVTGVENMALFKNWTASATAQISSGSASISMDRQLPNISATELIALVR